MWMPLGHRRPVQDGKTYETVDHDKGTAIVEHPTPDTKPPAADLETGSKADSLGGPSERHISKIISVLFKTSPKLLPCRQAHEAHDGHARAW